MVADRLADLRFLLSAQHPFVAVAAAALAGRQGRHAFGVIAVDDLAGRRVAQTDIARDLSFVDLALVRPDDLAAAFVLFGRTEPAGVFVIHVPLDNKNP